MFVEIINCLALHPWAIINRANCRHLVQGRLLAGLLAQQSPLQPVIAYQA
jgi:hypothetical protein